jgi:hypothetical protein
MIDNSNTQSFPTKKYTYRNNNLRTSLVTYAWLIFTIFSAAVIIILGYMFFLFQNILAFPTAEYKQAFYNFAFYLKNINIGVLIVYLTSVVIFLGWIYRANNNMHSLNPDKKFKFTPLKCILSFFIPLLCLVWPVETMEEIWQASQKPSDVKHKNSILTWFIIFLLYNVGQYSYHADKIVNVSATLLIGIIINCLGIIAAFMLIKIAREINRNQNGIFIAT